MNLWSYRMTYVQASPRYGAPRPFAETLDRLAAFGVYSGPTLPYSSAAAWLSEKNRFGRVTNVADFP